jgi:drug/metabolite transporter (DMT)-like permease
MGHLIFSILSSTFILIIFKSLARFRINLFLVIILNYLTASVLGVFLTRKGWGAYYLQMHHYNWFYPAIIIGIMLIAIFFMIGISAQKTGMAVTSVSTRISVAIPMLFSIVYYHDPVNLMKITGGILAVAALILTTIKNKETVKDTRYLYFPILIFFGMGLLDAMVKFTQHAFIAPKDVAFFTGASFTFAFIFGMIACCFRKTSLKAFLNPKVIFAGVLLGVSNFGSMFFLVNALNSRIFDSSVIFGINSVGIVGLSIFLALILFKERLSRLNWTGVFLAAGAIITLVSA